MKDDELIWIVCAICFLGIGVIGIWFGGINALGFVHIFIVLSVIFIYGIVTAEKVRYSEKMCPKKGKESFCYIYDKKQGDNDSVIYYVVVHLDDENINKLARYQSFENTKLKCGQIVKGYYYKEKVVLEKKNLDTKALPQNIIEAFELYD